MIWAAVLALAVASFALKAVGPVVIGRRPAPPLVTAALDLLPIPMLAAIVAVATVTTGHHLQVDARLPASPWRGSWSGAARRSSP